MIKLREKFMHHGDWIHTSQPIELISVHDSYRCRSGIAIRTNFTSLQMQLDIDSKFIFDENEIVLLKNKETREVFFRNFLTSSDYGI